MKRLVTILMLSLTLLACVLPAAQANQMQDGVPVWTEASVKQYLLDYIAGNNMNRLWNYFDLQIRRYMPMETYEVMLSELEFLTGDFVSLGEYRCFTEPENELKTHVVHLVMEKQDLDVYFIHKNKTDDWEVMALEFALADEVAAEQEASEDDAQ